MGAVEDRAEQSARWEFFGRSELSNLPVYERICAGVAGDDDLLDLMSHAPKGQRRPNLLLALVHDLLLAGVDHPLAAWYPTVSGHPPAGGDPFPAFADLVATHSDHIAEGLATRATQTNEVNRSCLWWVALAELRALGVEKVALIEIGASAGLNLLVDRYRYRFGDLRVGDGPSGAELVCQPIGDGTAEVIERSTMPLISHRGGLDRSPVDPADPVQARWLRACIWPEQPERLARLDAALAIAADDATDRPWPLVTAADAVDGVVPLIEACPADATVVLISSWLQTYLARDRRAGLRDMIDGAGATRDLVWVSTEAPTVVDWMEHDQWGPTHDRSVPSLVGARTWRDGTLHTALVARCHPHLAWLDWRGFGW